MTATNRTGCSIATARSAVALTIGLAGTGGVCAAEQAASSANTATELQEVIVTATRQEESLSKVPISVSVLTSADLDLKGIRDISDVVRYTPGMTVDLSQTNAISIRGISSTTGAGTTGIYIDDTPIQMRTLSLFASDNALVKVFDLDRIEVLRGPQGTLFGSGSEGGTVRYITTQPSLTQYTGHAKAETSFTASGDPSYEVGVAGGGPVVEGKLGVRASAWYRRDGGWIDSVDPLTYDLIEKNENFDDTVALRLAALWQATDWLKIAPSFLYQSRDRNATTNYWPILSDPGSAHYVNANPTSTAFPDRFYLPALNVEADFGPARLIATTSYFDRNDKSGFDGSLYVLSLFQQYMPLLGGDLSLFPLVDQNGLHIPAGLENQYQNTTTYNNKQHNFTQEVRLQSTDPNARLTWTAGVFYSDSHQVSYEQDYEPDVDALFLRIFGAPFGLVFGTPMNPDGTTYVPNGLTNWTLKRTRDEQLAAFGEVSFKLTDALKLTAGLRVAKSKLDLTDDAGGANNGRKFSAEQDEKPVTPKFGLSYQINGNHLAYATYAEGFRPGGTNHQIRYQDCALDFQNFGIDGAPLEYGSDSVNSMEIGSKNNIHNRIRLATSVWYIKWKDIQQNVVMPICAGGWTQNLGEAVSKGFDLQATIAATEALTLDLAVGYTDARYSVDAFPGTATTNVKPVVSSGNALTDQNGVSIVPWTVAAGIQYAFNAFSYPSFLRVDYQYSGDGKYDPPTLDARNLQYNVGTATFYQPLRSWQFVSLRAGTSFNDWSASFFVDNLLDTHATLANLNTTPTYDFFNGDLLASPLRRAIPFRPRTIGVALTYRF